VVDIFQRVFCLCGDGLDQDPLICASWVAKMIGAWQHAYFFPIKMGSQELFAGADLELLSSQSPPLELLG
jgi:hypothetical protein